MSSSSPSQSPGGYLAENVRALEEGQAVTLWGWQIEQDLPGLNLDLNGRYTLTADNRLTVHS